MKLPIYLYGHPVLRQEAAPITADNSGELKKLVDLPLLRLARVFAW